MKNGFRSMALMIIALMFGQVYGQNSQTKTVGKGGGARPLVSPLGTESNLHDLNRQLRQQMRQARLDMKSGKLSREQGKTLWEQFKFIRRQELEFFKQNGRKELTDSQKQQIQAQLEQNKNNL